MPIKLEANTTYHWDMMKMRARHEKAFVITLTAWLTCFNPVGMSSCLQSFVMYVYWL